MRRFVLLAAALAAPFSVPAQTSVGVSIGINQPGVYGRVDFGNLPAPPVILSHPVLIVAQPVAVAPAPLYLYVPPGHRKHWAKHCAAYNACGYPVYFVQETWIRERYEHEHGGGKGHGHGKDKKQHD